MPPSTDGWTPLLPLEKAAFDRGVFLELDGRELAVFRLADGSVHVIDNACPHANGNLAAGEVVDGVVSCPWHGWKFRLCDGASTQGSRACVTSYPVDIRDGIIHVRLD